MTPVTVSTKKALPLGGSLERRRVLVVDDHASNRQVLARLLTPCQCDIGFATNGQEALAILESEDFDLVLLDIMMPVLDGFATLEQMKAHPRLDRIPVIVITASDATDSAVRCIEAGAEDYVTKPFNRVLLLARIHACLEKKRLRDHEERYLTAIRNELRLGQQIQADFLPQSLPAIPGWAIEARFRAAHEVAGDFYDVFPLPGDRLAFVVADVCDKGIGAALFMALVRTLIRVFTEHARPGAGSTSAVLSRATLGAVSAVQRTNDYIIAHHWKTNMFASLFLGVLDPGTGSMAYVNAGHEPPLHVGPCALKGRLTKTGPAIGTQRAARYEWGHVEIARGDAVIAYTDGITEARDPAGRLFTEARLSQVVSARQGPGAVEAAVVVERIEAALAAHVAGAEPSDDVTLLVLERQLGSSAG